MIFDIIFHAKKLFFGFTVIEILFRYTKLMTYSKMQFGAEPELAKSRSKGAGVGAIKGK